MKLLSLLSLFLFFFSTAMANTVFDKILAAKDKKEASFELQFEDGFKQVIKGPIEIEEGPQLRCPCTVYNVTFTDAYGKRMRRTITVQSLSGKIEYVGGDGKTYYIADIVKPSEANENAKPGEPCVLRGKLQRFRIKTRKVIENNGKSCPVNGTVQCLGEEIVKCEGVAECTDHPEYGTGTYEIYCMSKDGKSCPSAMECINDTAYDEYHNEAESFDLEISKEVKSSWQK